jgi:hypothetical protein
MRAAALLLALAAAAPAEARRAWRVGIRGGAGIVWDRGFDAFAEGDGIPRFGLALEAPLLPRDDLALDFGYEISGAAAALHAGSLLRAGLIAHAFDAGASWRLALPFGLAFAARGGLALLLANASVQFTNDLSQPALSAWSARPGAQASVSLEWAPGLEKPHFGSAALQIGWLLQWPFSFELSAEPPPDDDPKKRLPWTSADAGALDLGGPFARLVFSLGG